MKPAVEIEIGDLVLTGFPRAHADDIAAALRSHLASLLIDGGVPPHFQSPAGAARLDAGSFDVRAASTPAAIGAQVAHALYGGLVR
jgi:hypothetical protein